MSFENEPKFQVWKNRLLQSGCTINNLTPLNLIYKKNNDLLFALLDTNIASPEGYSLPNIALIRGDVCVIVPLLIDEQSREERLLMVKQRRIGHGSLALEFPAGMLDRNINEPRKVAQNELFEETGLHVSENELFTLTDQILFSSPGIHDEGVYYFGCKITLSHEEFNSFHEKSINNTSDNEHIIVTLKTRGECKMETSSLQALLGLYLFNNYCIKNKL